MWNDGVGDMSIIGKTLGSLREGFNKVAGSDTARGAAIGAALGFALMPGELTARFTAAIVGSAIGGLVGENRLRSMFNLAAQEPEPQPVPVRIKPSPPQGRRP